MNRRHSFVSVIVLVSLILSLIGSGSVFAADRPIRAQDCEVSGNPGGPATRVGSSASILGRDNTIQCGGGGDFPIPPPTPPAPSCPRSAGVAVYINGECTVFDLPLVIVNGRIMFPLRELIETLARDYYGNIVFVDWTGDPTDVGDDNTAWAWSPATLLGFPQDQNWMYWDGAVIPLDQGGVIIDGRMRVPLRHVVEKFGGIITWDAEDMSANINTQYMWQYRSKPEHVCAQHGYPTMESCPAGEFFAGEWVYRTWGHEFLRDTMIRSGLMADRNRVAHINKMGMDHRGRPLEGPALDWKGAAVDTFMQVATDIWIAGMLKNVLWPVAMETPGLPVSQIELGGMFSEPTQNGLFKVFRNGWSKHAADYQARYTGAQYVKHETGYVFEEYFLNGAKFDHGRTLSDGMLRLIETKSDGGWFARMLRSEKFMRAKWEESIRSELLRQYSAVKGSYAHVNWHVETAQLKSEIEAIFNSLPQTTRAEMAEYFTFHLSP